MDYFKPGGPKAIAPKLYDMAEQQEQVRAEFFRHFLVDMIELNMRKVALQNTKYCATRCHIFKDMLEKDLSHREQRQEDACFETCLGKHTDSFEVALDCVTKHLAEEKAKNAGQIVSTKGAVRGMSQMNEPVYDTPKPQPKPTHF